MTALADNQPWHCQFCGYSTAEKYLRDPQLFAREMEMAKERGRVKAQRRIVRQGSTIQERASYFVSDLLEDHQAKVIIGGIAIGTIIVLAAWASIVTPSIQQQQTAVAKTQPVSDKTAGPEKDYLTAVGNYLQMLDGKNQSLAATMAGASTGKSSLNEIRIAITDAQMAESNFFSGTYLAKTVPIGYQDIDGEIKAMHSSYVATFDEYQKYWRDNRLSHINKGSDLFKAAVLRADGVTKKLTAKLKTLNQ